MSKSIAKVSLLCFSLLVLSIIGFYFSQLVLASPDSSQYDYNLGQGTIHFVYEGSADSYPPSFTGNSWVGTQIASYTNVQSDNAAYIDNVDYGSNFEPFFRFNFTISEAEGTINWIYWHINGYGVYGPGEEATCYIANFDTSTWDVACSIPGSDGDCDYNISSSVTSYVDSNSQVVAICVGKNLDDAADLRIDYVQLTVDYTGAVACDGYISNTTIEFPDAGPGDSIEPIVQSSSGTLKAAINVSITQGTNCKVGFYAKDYFNDTSDHSFDPNTYEKYTVNPAGDIDWGSISTYVPVGIGNIVYPASCSGQAAPFNCSFYFNLTIPSGQFPSDYNKTAVFTIEDV